MEEKVDLSKPGPKPSKKLFDTTNYVFREVDMSCVKSKVWKHFLRDKIVKSDISKLATSLITRLFPTSATQDEVKVEATN